MLTHNDLFATSQTLEAIHKICEVKILLDTIFSIDNETDKKIARTLLGFCLKESFDYGYKQAFSVVSSKLNFFDDYTESSSEHENDYTKGLEEAFSEHFSKEQNAKLLTLLNITKNKAYSLGYDTAVNLNPFINKN